MSDDNIFCVEDYRGEEVIFSKKKWQEKKSDHPELNKKKFIECLKRAIIEPDEVWEDYDDKKHKRCYYKKYSIASYAKAVIWIEINSCNVVTAFEISDIKEAKYPNLKRLV